MTAASEGTMNSRAAALPRDEASGRFVVNVGSSLVYVVLNTGIMFWYIPFLLKHLGVAAYGMVPCRPPWSCSR